MTDGEKAHEPNEVDQRCLATHDESKCPDTGPRRAGDYPARGTEREGAITAANAAAFRNRGGPSTMLNCATADNWPDLLRRAVGGVGYRLKCSSWNLI